MPSITAMRRTSPSASPTAGEVGHEGMQGWDRERDNRLRSLRMRLEAGAELTAEERQEAEELEVVNQKFLAAGIAFQRGEGLRTWDTLVVLMGYSIGVGNLWRFSYLVAKHGGLVFILAYTICLFVVARPVYLLELALGQDKRCGVVHCHRAVGRRWAGIGYGFVAAMIIVQGYYGMFLSYSLVYMANSMITPLPWSDEAYWDPVANTTTVPLGMTSAEYFWEKDVLARSFTGSTGFGKPQWPLVVCLLLSYVLIFLAVWRGIRFATKIAYVTVIMPAILLLVMIIWCATLEGAGDGISYYLTNFEAKSLYNIDMWGDACAQTLFSLLFLPGTTATLASYMQEKEDVYKVHRLVAYANALFAFLGGFAIFSVIGHTHVRSCRTEGVTKFHECRSVEEIAKSSGGGLAFIALADGIATIPHGGNVFGFFFFLMCFTLALDTCFAGVEVLCTFAADNFTYFQLSSRQDVIAAAWCVILFLSGLLYTTNSGFTLLEVVDHYLNTYTMLIGQVLHCVMFRLDWTWENLAAMLQRNTIGHPGFPRGREVSEKIRTLLYWVVPAACVVFLIGMFVTDCIEPFGDRNGRGYSAGYRATAIVMTVLVHLVMPLATYVERKYAERTQAASAASIAMKTGLLEHELSPVDVGVSAHSAAPPRAGTAASLNSPDEPPARSARGRSVSTKKPPTRVKRAARESPVVNPDRDAGEDPKPGTPACRMDTEPASGPPPALLDPPSAEPAAAAELPAAGELSERGAEEEADGGESAGGGPLERAAAAAAAAEEKEEEEEEEGVGVRERKEAGGAGDEGSETEN
eukprot:TRINITY_DN414_c1_g2_i1.p1 TRINITY_DN414_c1_g2~~TRINITY_DN414_c1_g2_i1.p1  ORF type:complete len:807 (+),score=228.64 TRINITY_DN414_c1_g2_i1:72-2492(+)